MPTLCFGGSFNPIHHGHLICARAVAEQKRYEQVILIPSAQPPHKPAAANLAPASDRVRMCQLAIHSPSIFLVDDVEVSRTGPSYTIDTVEELQRRGSSQVHWLIGADMLLYLPHWHRPLDLLRLVHFVVVARPGWSIDWSTLAPEYRELRDHVVDAPLIDISATEIRRRVAAGLSIDYLTPPEVCRYIGDRALYRDPDASAPPP